jgi:hypothetical protein
MSDQPAFLREELFKHVDQWCQQLFGTEDKPEAAAYELARLAAEYAAIEALYGIRIRMGDHTYRYQDDDGTLTYQQAEDSAFDGLAALQEHERQVERQACITFLSKAGHEAIANRLLIDSAIKQNKQKIEDLAKSTENRSLTYEEFLQVPQVFVDDAVKILNIKKKWGLDLTDDEKTIRRHIKKMYLTQAAKHLNSSTEQQ